MNYEETINYIEGLAVFGSQPGFERINALLDGLDHPEKGMQYVHVAGTNGKGSVCTTTANILKASGLKVGLFTSPFVSDFRERIQINGEFIPKDSITRICEHVKSVTDNLVASGIQPTEFEVITAIAFLYFKSESCDVVVLEVGLGGLLDSTNVIDTPLVSAIVSLSFDHMGVLGNTIEEIAAQKAGIIKKGATTVTAPHQPEGALHVIRTAAFEMENKLVIADPTEIKTIATAITGTQIEYNGNKINLRLIGPHQIDNLSVVLSIIGELKLKGYKITDEDIKSGIEATTVPARIEVVSMNPLVIIDGGHNEDGAAVLAETLKELTSNIDKTLIMGVMADKEVSKVVKQLAPHASTVITTTPRNPRAMAAEELRSEALKFCNNVVAIDDPCAAFDFAKSTTSPEKCIVICGSLYLAGDVRLHVLDSLSSN